MKKNSLLFLVSGCLMFMVIQNVFAQGVRRDSEGGDAVAKIQYLLKQTAAERDALKVENDQLSVELEKLSDQVEGLQAKNKSLQKDLGKSDLTLEKFKESDAALREYIERQKERTEEIIEKFKSVVADLRAVEAERAELETNVSNLDGEVKACATKNIELYEIGLQLIDQYKNKGVWDSVAQREPVTGLKQVEIENLIQDYKLRLTNEKYLNLVTTDLLGARE
jgi:peptidoglycan hydrolase CwlO-like protein